MSILHDILLYVFVVVGSINFLHLALFIIGANIYDIKAARKSKNKRVHTRDRNWQAYYKLRGIEPGFNRLVSVVVPAHNEELAIQQCLDSIRRNTYRKIEVIVHDDKSTDSTARIVRAYKKKYPKMQLRLVSRRKNVGKGAGVNYCIKKYAKGDFVMTLDADCLLDPNAVKNAVRYFDDPSVVGVAANVKILETPSVLGLLQRFEHMIAYRSKKFYTLTNCEIIVGGVASTYRREVLRAVNYYDTDTQTEDMGLSMKIVSIYGSSSRIVYAADVLAMTEPVQTFKDLLTQRYRWKLGMIQNLIKYRSMIGNLQGPYNKMLTLYRLPIAFLSEIALMLEPLIIGYVVYLSITSHSTMMFVGAYLTITLYVILGIWPDEHLTRKQKFSQSVYAPTMYFIFYIMDIVQVVAAFKVASNPRKALRHGYTDSSWVSPTRAARV